MKQSSILQRETLAFPGFQTGGISTIILLSCENQPWVSVGLPAEFTEPSPAFHVAQGEVKALGHLFLAVFPAQHFSLDIAGGRDGTGEGVRGQGGI